MATPEEVSASLSAEATALRATAGTANTALLSHADDLDAMAADLLPPPEPPPGPLHVTDVTVGATQSTIVLHWRVPEGSQRTLLSWGTGGGQVGKQFVLPGTAGPQNTYTISGLQPGTAYTVDLLAAQLDGTFNSDEAPDGGRVRVAATTLSADGPTEPDPDPPAGDYPADPAAWDAKRDWTIGVAGAPESGLTVINSSASLAAAGLPGAWVNGQWSLSSGGPFEGIDVQGLIYYTGQAPLTLRNGRSRGLVYASTAGKSGGHRFEQWTFGPNPAGRALGQGALNFYGQASWSVYRCELFGFADGSQCSGTGLFEECLIHDLAYGPSTHNDWIQHYGGGLVRCVRTVFDSVPPQANAHNGVFSSNDTTADYELVDCDCRVSGAHEGSSNILHANTGTITLVRTRARGGRVIADVRWGADSLVSGDPNAV